MSAPQNTIAYIPTPISEVPPDNKHYTMLFADGLTSANMYMVFDGKWPDEVYRRKYTHWLRPVDLSSLLSLAWDAGIERFCFDNGSEFVEGKPKDKKDFINSILNPTK